MTFSRVKEFGYNTGDVIADVEINQLDIDHANAIDGSGGGTYDNDPITLKGDLTVEGDLTGPDFEARASGQTFLTADEINIGANSATTNVGTGGTNVNIGGLASVANFGVGAAEVNIGGDEINIGGNVVSASAITVGHDSSDTLEIKATSTVSSSITLNGGVALGSILIGTGSGRIRPRVTIGTDANASYGPATTDIVYVTVGVLSANRQYTIDDTGAGDGDTITFATEDGSFSIEILNPSSSTIGLIQRVNGSNTAYTFIRVGGLWRVLNRSYFDDSSP